MKSVPSVDVCSPLQLKDSTYNYSNTNNSLSAFAIVLAHDLINIAISLNLHYIILNNICNVYCCFCDVLFTNSPAAMPSPKKPKWQKGTGITLKSARIPLAKKKLKTQATVFPAQR